MAGFPGSLALDARLRSVAAPSLVPSWAGFGSFGSALLLFYCSAVLLGFASTLGLVYVLSGRSGALARRSCSGTVGASKDMFRVFPGFQRGCRAPPVFILRLRWVELAISSLLSEVGCPAVYVDKTRKDFRARCIQLKGYSSNLPRPAPSASSTRSAPSARSVPSACSAPLTHYADAKGALHLFCGCVAPILCFLTC